MVNDTEPRYRLVDADGNVVGSLFAESDGTLKLQEGTSGSDNEVSVATDGTFNAPAVSTGVVDITDVTSGDSSDIVRSEVNSTKLHRSSIEFTDGVGTTATPIFDRTDPQIRGATADVFVRVGGSAYAVDQVLITFADGATLDSSRERGTVPSRTYSVNSGSLTLAMGSGSADVVVSATELNTTDPNA